MIKEKETFLITGVAGFIGAALAIKLLENGKNIIGIDNINNYYDVNLKEKRLKRIEKKAKNSKGSWVFSRVDISNNNGLVYFDTTGSSIECIQVSQYQLDNQISNASIDGISSEFRVYYNETGAQVFNEIDWEISTTATYSLDCN